MDLSLLFLSRAGSVRVRFPTILLSCSAGEIRKQGLQRGFGPRERGKSSVLWGILKLCSYDRLNREGFPFWSAFNLITQVHFRSLFRTGWNSKTTEDFDAAREFIKVRSCGSYSRRRWRRSWSEDDESLSGRNENKKPILLWTKQSLVIALSFVYISVLCKFFFENGVNNRYKVKSSRYGVVLSL